MLLFFLCSFSAHALVDMSSGVIDMVQGSDVVIDGGVLDEVVVNAPAIKAGDACPSDRLPQFATAGMYIKNGKNPDTGLDKFVCAATECRDGTYLVKNDAGVSQGWCRAGTAPTTVNLNTADVGPGPK